MVICYKEEEGMVEDYGVIRLMKLTKVCDLVAEMSHQPFPTYTHSRMISVVRMITHSFCSSANMGNSMRPMTFSVICSLMVCLNESKASAMSPR